MLEIKGLTKYFSGLAAVSNVDIVVNAGDILGLIGPNGAGKTTVFNLVTGFLHPTKGKLIFEGENITKKSPHYISSLGIIRTFQANNIFPDFTVLQNLIFARHLEPRINLFEAIFRTASISRKEKAILSRCKEILESTGLSSMADTQAKNLAHGHKRMLGIAIALAAEPKLLLLDEPLTGMNAMEVDETLSIIRGLWERGITIVMIEHNMRAAMSLCQKIVVLNFGKKIAEGTPDEIKANDEVIEAYLGAH
jgi:branched-chain amino acid transport system ATP-binding protein